MSLPPAAPAAFGQLGLSHLVQLVQVQVFLLHVVQLGQVGHLVVLGGCLVGYWGGSCQAAAGLHPPSRLCTAWSVGAKPCMQLLVRTFTIDNLAGVTTYLATASSIADDCVMVWVISGPGCSAWPLSSRDRPIYRFADIFGRYRYRYIGISKLDIGIGRNIGQ